MRELPKKVVYPDLETLGHYQELDAHFRWPLATLRALAFGGGEVAVVIDSSLKLVGWSGLPMVVDGVEVVVDASNYCDTHHHAVNHRHWFRYDFLSVMAAYPFYAHFPKMSFFDWQLFVRLCREVRFNPAQSSKILCVHGEGRGAATHHARVAARKTLETAFPRSVHTAWQDQESYWRLAGDCVCSVHVPGAWNNLLDRAQWQMMALGVCTVSPTIHNTVLGDQLVPDVHYVACLDDYSDLIEVVEWCRSDPRRTERIGDSAARFFADHGTPRRIWESVKARISGVK